MFGRELIGKLYNTGYENIFYVDLTDSLESMDLRDKREKWQTYIFNGINVPRTTEIINNTINKEYLNKWAAKLGKDYNRALNTILDTGSLAHAMIEDFITYGKIKEKYLGFENADPLKAMKAYHNFLNFWKDMKAKGFIIEPIAIELPFSTPWYGGTIDFIAKITSPEGVSKTFILDFKTSNKISYNYFLQLTMYKQAIEFLVQNYNFYDIQNTQPQFTIELIQALSDIRGIGIIRVDKERNTYEYQLAELETDYVFLYNLNQAASSMVNWYYQMQFVDKRYMEFKKNYGERGGIYGIFQ